MVPPYPMICLIVERDGSSDHVAARRRSQTEPSEQESLCRCPKRFLTRGKWGSFGVIEAYVSTGVPHGMSPKANSARHGLLALYHRSHRAVDGSLLRVGSPGTSAKLPRPRRPGGSSEPSHDARDACDGLFRASDSPGSENTTAGSHRSRDKQDINLHGEGT